MGTQSQHSRENSHPGYRRVFCYCNVLAQNKIRSNLKGIRSAGRGADRRGMMRGPPLGAHVRNKYMDQIEIHPRPEEAKCQITMHPKMKEIEGGGKYGRISHVSNRMTPPGLGSSRPTRLQAYPPPRSIVPKLRPKMRQKGYGVGWGGVGGGWHFTKEKNVTIFFEVKFSLWPRGPRSD